jgi:prepilin-type N-terminal cleavage/methylation domain-containing protein
MSVTLPMRQIRAFTLVEIVIAVAIMGTLLLLAVPSLQGVIADRKLRASLDGFNKLVREAQVRSVADHRAYLLVWTDKSVFVRPEAFAKDEDRQPIASFDLERGSALTLKLPAALSKKTPGEWIFWPTGTCEPAIVQYTGRAGTWTANYAPLTAHAELTKYAAR